VAISPSGRLIAVLETPRARTAPLVLRAANGSERSVKVSYAYSNVGFPSDSSVVVVNESGAWQLRDAASLRAIATYNTFAAPAGFVLPGIRTPDIAAR
jgi:hypothetical protein